MHCIRPCPSCSVNLRIPLDGGILHIRCPNCDHRFIFNPAESEEPSPSFSSARFDLPRRVPSNPIPSFSSSDNSDSNPPSEHTWNLGKLTAQRIIPGIMFLLLGIYAIRGCAGNLIDPNPDHGSNPIQNDPDYKLNPHPPKDNFPDPEEKSIQAPYSI